VRAATTERLRPRSCKGGRLVDRAEARILT
jgi:hypothetical protein